MAAPPNKQTYQLLLDAWCGLGRLDYALHVFDHIMATEFVSLNYTPLLQLCLAQQLPLCLNVFHQLHSHIHPIDQRLYALLLRKCNQAQQYAETLRLYAQLWPREKPSPEILELVEAARTAMAAESPPAHV
eukprot:NODE_5523_length_644_cov_12.764023_g5359_i0.p2 GENE.NODE_5523_length_644_cov_12.764023_g5359_i0~~NODE_5523_length_644_cov_12.764023_g5359_i0.p2  ORF type:complete len:131 (+),score=42.12 NODE_5523_length_644_cov_12.764023_g5359_i0:234-626(+)